MLVVHASRSGDHLGCLRNHWEGVNWSPWPFSAGGNWQLEADTLVELTYRITHIVVYREEVFRPRERQRRYQAGSPCPAHLASREAFLSLLISLAQQNHNNNQDGGFAWRITAIHEMSVLSIDKNPTFSLPYRMRPLRIATENGLKQDPHPGRPTGAWLAPSFALALPNPRPRQIHRGERTTEGAYSSKTSAPSSCIS